MSILWSKYEYVFQSMSIFEVTILSQY